MILLDLAYPFEIRFKPLHDDRVRKWQKLRYNSAIVNNRTNKILGTYRRRRYTNFFFVFEIVFVFLFD